MLNKTFSLNEIIRPLILVKNQIQTSLNLNLLSIDWLGERSCSVTNIDPHFQYPPECL